MSNGTRSELGREALEAYWLPFTPNRLFKKNPRLISGAEGAYYQTMADRQLLDANSGRGGVGRRGRGLGLGHVWEGLCSLWWEGSIEVERRCRRSLSFALLLAVQVPVAAFYAERSRCPVLSLLCRCVYEAEPAVYVPCLCGFYAQCQRGQGTQFRIVLGIG